MLKTQKFVRVFLVTAFLILSSCVHTASEKPSEAVVVKEISTEQTLSRISFGSCSDQKLSQPIWNKILDLKPELYIAMGDNVYASRPKTDGSIAEAYQKQASIPEFLKFRSQIPIVATWDDHDYGLDDSGRENPRREEAREEFLKFFPYVKNELPVQRQGIYHSFIFGKEKQRVQIIMLDTRTYRSPLTLNPNPKTNFERFIPTKDLKATVLGDEQWVWLADELKKPAEIRLIVSSIQFLGNEHMFEMWGNFPAERERLLDLIKNSKMKNIFILSGDRHFSQISRIQLPGYGDLIEVTSSSINKYKGEFEEPNRYRLGSKYHKDNFALANIDWMNSKISFEIRDIDGAVITTHTQKLKLIR